MPPPRRAKMEISEGRKRSRPAATIRVAGSFGAAPIAYRSGTSRNRHAQQAQAHHQHAGDGAAAEGHVQRRADALVAACAVRTLARTDTFMPMKPQMFLRDDWPTGKPPVNKTGKGHASK